MKKTLIAQSAEQTLALGRELGEAAGPGDVFALTGDLGAGKTVLAKGIATGLGISDDITSPTFTLMEVYEGSLSLYHFDLYRIEDPRELDMLFFEEYWEGDGVSVVEWAERAAGRLPARAVRVILEYASDDARRITVEYPAD